jgi:hypothetical protein
MNLHVKALAAWRSLANVNHSKFWLEREAAYGLNANGNLHRYHIKCYAA